MNRAAAPPALDAPRTHPPRQIWQVRCLCDHCVQSAPYKADLREKHKGELQRMLARRFRKSEP